MSTKKQVKLLSAKIVTVCGGTFKLGIGAVDRLSIYTSLFNPIYNFELAFNDKTDIINKEKILSGDYLQIRILDEVSKISTTIDLVIAQIIPITNSDRSGLHSFVNLKGFSKSTYNLVTENVLMSIAKDKKGIDEIIKLIAPNIKIKSKPTNKIDQFVSNSNWTKLKALKYLQSISVQSGGNSDLLIYQDFLDDHKLIMDSGENLKSKQKVNSEAFVLGDKNIMYKFNILDYKLHEQSYADATKLMKHKSLAVNFVGFDPDTKEVLNKKIETKSKKMKNQLNKLQNKDNEIIKPKSVHNKDTFQGTGGEYVLSEIHRKIHILTNGTLDKKIISLGNIIWVNFLDKFDGAKKRDELNGNYILTHIAYHFMLNKGLMRSKSQLIKL